MSRRRIPTKAVLPDEDLPLAISPDGGRIHSEDQLPDLPLPKKVVVGRNIFHVDGWHILFYPMGQTMMNWIDRLLVGWNKTDPSPENHAQVIGVLEAVEGSVKSMLNLPMQGEFDF